MKLLMISGDRSVLQGKKGAFWYTLEEMSKHWERIDVLCPRAQQLSASGYQLSGKTIRRTESSKLKAESFFGNVFFHPSPRGLWYQPWWILEHGSGLIANHHHNVITVHEYPPFYNGVGARWLSRATGVPFILEIHHIVGYPRASSLSEHVGYWLSRVHLPRASRRAKAVRCVSSSMAEALRSWGVKNVEVVPSFYLDPEMLRPDPAVPRTYDIVVCARLVPNKGMREVLHALTDLPDRTLLIVGDGPERPHLEDHARRLGIESQVTFTGWLEENKDVYYALQTGHVFVMNSRSEGGPRVALEAMALGMPVVATPVGVMPDVVRHGENALFTTGDPEDLVEKLRVLLGDAALRERLGSEAQKVRDQFERRKLIQLYADFLKRFIRSMP